MAVHYQNKKYGNGAYLSCFTCTVCKTRKKKKQNPETLKDNGENWKDLFPNKLFFFPVFSGYIFLDMVMVIFVVMFCCVLLRGTEERFTFFLILLHLRSSWGLIIICCKTVYIFMFFFFFPVVYLCLCLLPAVLFRLDHNFQHIFVAKYNKAVVELCWVRDKVMSIINCDVPGR